MIGTRKYQWIRVSSKEPCRICGRGDWCTVTADGRLALCMRTPSDRPSKNKMGGWLHPLSRKTAPTRPVGPGREPAAPVERLATDALQRAHAVVLRATEASRLERHAAALGVKPAALRELGFAWSELHRAWAIPMYDADRGLIGMRLRAENGFKWAVPGSRNGLFWPERVPGDQNDTLLVCEGPTTCAALRSLDFDVVGRPNCSACVEMIVALVRRERRHVVIVGDEDSAKRRPDGSVFFPGQEGAAVLAKALKGAARSVRLVFPLEGKDARDWIVKHGTDRATVQMVIENARYVR